MQSVYRYFLIFRPFLMILYLALGGMLCVFSAQAYLGMPLNYGLGIISMGIIFAVYSLNRFTDTREDFANDLGSLMFFLERKFLYAAAVIALGGIVLTLAIFQKLSSYHLFLIALGLFYSYRLLPWYRPGEGFIFRRLKEFILVKNILVAALWGISIFAIPLLFTDYALADYSMVYILAASITLSTFNNTICCDIRHIAGDQLADNRTLPCQWGSKKSYLLLLAINLLWLILLVSVYFTNLIDWKHFLFLLLMFFHPLIYILPYYYSSFQKTVIDFLSESDLLLFMAGLALLSIF